LVLVSDPGSAGVQPALELAVDPLPSSALATRVVRTLPTSFSFVTVSLTLCAPLRGAFPLQNPHKSSVGGSDRG
ncbi:MAG: hypothetical protein ACK5PF_09190, partial [bacterium]